MLNESILDKLMQFESDKEILTIGHWMMKNPPYITLDKTLRDATLILRNERIDFLPVVNEALNPIGVITIDDVMDAFLNGDLGETKLEHMMSPKVTSIMESTLLSELLSYTDHNHIVTNKLGSLTGIIREEDILQGIITLINRYVKNEKVTAILNVILEKAYEGIAVVDEEGILIEFNDAYSKFTGISRENAIGKHVTEVIENTGLHKTVKKGIPARSVLQNIQGQEMIVHRIPIWNNGKVVGAIGMLIFEGVSEVYRIYERLQLQKVVTTKNTDSNQQNNLASIDQIVGISEKNSELKRLARKAGQNRANVLLIGENGAGKKIFAESIHQLSSVKTGPFISFNCASMREENIPKELFDENGKFALAENGTLYLEEIDVLSKESQLMLLDVLREERIDFKNNSYPINVRMMVSSTKNLKQLVDKHQFDLNLYNKLNIINLNIPPLRERKEDIPILLSHYMREICFKHQIPEKTLTTTAVHYLMNYHWPGNIYELVNVIEKLVSLVDDEDIEHTDLPETILAEVTENTFNTEENMITKIKEKQEEREKELILSLLKKTNGNKSKTAELLGIHRTTLYKKLEKFNIRT